jgi:ABC-type transport system involved in cytochrome bd biosynthesis fused ATPase/permease subunit
MNDLISGTKLEGKVLIDGHDIYSNTTDVVDLRKKVGMVFQKSNPFPKTIFDNVAYGSKAHGIRDKAKLAGIVEESLKKAALWDEVSICPGSYLYCKDRGADPDLKGKVYHCHRHPQYAAGGKGLRLYWLFPVGGDD